MTRRRLDAEMVRRHLAGSRSEAQQLIGEGRVTVDGAPAPKASRQVDHTQTVAVAGPPRRFVSRGGDKLDAALEQAAIGVAGRRCVDAGASTGGFTDCLLQRGAIHVVAFDVGHGQLSESLRTDARVTSIERLHVRDAGVAVGPVGELVVADLSFISLRSVAGDLIGLCRPGADLVALVKPQFEAGRDEVRSGRGVIRDPEVWRRALVDACAAFERAGATIMGTMVSPIHGTSGNTEFFVHATAPR